MLTSAVKTSQDAVREVSSLFYRGIEKLYDRFFWKDEEEIAGRAFFRELLSQIQKEPKRFASEVVHQLHEDSVDIESFSRFKKGFNSSTYTFMSHIPTESRKWVFKVGHRISPVIYFGDPSEKEYTQSTQKHFLQLKETILSYPSISSLLPHETVIEWVEIEKIGRTTMLQYFYEVLDKDEVMRLKKSIRKSLLDQLQEASRFFNELGEKHSLYPDLLGSENLVIVRDHHRVDPHFILLDIGLMDFKHPLPITKKAMQLSLKKTIDSYAKLLA
jgi:hypothetical protein